MQRRFKTVDVLTRRKAAGGYRAGIVTSLIAAGTQGQKLRDQSSGLSEFDYRGDRLNRLITPTSKRRALPANEPGRIAPDGNFSAGQVFKSAWKNPLRRAGSSFETMRAKSGNTFDTANGRLANRFDGYHAADAASAAAHAKLADVIAAGAGSLGAERKGRPSAARSERVASSTSKLDYQVHTREGILEPEKPRRF